MTDYQVVCCVGGLEWRNWFGYRVVVSPLLNTGIFSSILRVDPLVECLQVLILADAL